MSSPRWRPVRAFLLAPLCGTGVCALFAFLFAHDNPLFFIFLMEGVLVCAYAGTLIIGLPLYGLLAAAGDVRPNYFVYAFTAGGLGLWLYLFWHHFSAKGAVPLFVLCCATGFATGAIFAGLLRPPAERVADR
jgi:hypothetical protein